MERMLVVVVFDNERKAYAGKSALLELQRERSVTLYADAVVVKHGDGAVTYRETNESGPRGALAGTAVRGLIGLFVGPAGLEIGATSGLAFGATYDVDTARVGWDFVDNVMKSLTPNRVALVAEVDEEWTIPVDTRMEALGGTVFRRALCSVEVQARREEIDAMKADFALYRRRNPASVLRPGRDRRGPPLRGPRRLPRDVRSGRAAKGAATHSHFGVSPQGIRRLSSHIDRP